MFLNGFRTQIGAIPEFGQGVPEAVAQGYAMERLNEQDALAQQERQRAEEAKRQLAQALKQDAPANMHSLIDADPQSYLTIRQQSQPNYGWQVVNGELVRTGSDGTATPMGAFGAPVLHSDIADANARSQLATEYGLTGAAQQEFILTGKLPAPAPAPGPRTEAERRNQQLGTVMLPEAQRALDNWSALGDTGNQTWNGINVPGLGNVAAGMTSGAYKQAQGALSTIAQSYLYSTSGAAAPVEEVQKLVDAVSPKPFDDENTKKAKLARLQTMVGAVIGNSGDPQLQSRFEQMFGGAGAGGGGGDVTNMTDDQLIQMLGGQ